MPGERLRRASSSSCDGSGRTPNFWSWVPFPQARSSGKRPATAASRNVLHPSCAAIFDCERPFDELMARLSKHFRRNLRSHRKKLASLANVQFMTTTDEADLAVEFETFLDVEASGWKGQAGVGSAIALHPEITSFYRRFAIELSGGDHSEINALYADGRCIASQFCVLSGEQYSILKIAYDEGYARIAPGLLLLEQTLDAVLQGPGRQAHEPGNRRCLATRLAPRRHRHETGTPGPRPLFGLARCVAPLSVRTWTPRWCGGCAAATRLLYEMKGEPTPRTGPAAPEQRLQSARSASLTADRSGKRW